MASAASGWPLGLSLTLATFTGRPSRSTGWPNTTVTVCPELRSRLPPPPSSSSTTGTLKPALPSRDFVASTVSTTVIDSTGS
jgi:hypothetical protein